MLRERWFGTSPPRDMADVAAPGGDTQHASNGQEVNIKQNSTNINSSATHNDVEGSVGPNEVKKDVLEEALAQLGHFRFYQKYVVLLLCLPNVVAAMYSLNYVFVADQVPFRCVIPECEGSSPEYSNPSAWSLQPGDGCRRYLPLVNTTSGGQTCSREHYHATDTVICNQLVYLNQDTIVAEFDLGCQEWKRTLVGTVRNSALPLALILTGYISDSFGRRTAFCVFAACAGVMGITKSFSVSYPMYVTLEFFEAALGYGFNSAGYVMMVELARPSLRATFACATGIAYGFGGVLFALVAWLVPYWRRLLVTVYCPALILPVYWFLLDESPRWLHATGRLEKCGLVIRKAARWNKMKLNDEIMKSLVESNPSPATLIQKPIVSPWLNVLKSRVLMCRLAICGWCWVATTFVYYGLTINSVSLSGDKYVNFALNMSMEIVASIIIVMSLERFGRRKSIFVAFLLCGVSCVVPYFISHTGTSLGLFFLGKLSISFAFNSLYVLTAELFPTAARSSALSACSLVGRLGSVLAPQTPLLSVSVQACLYGICALLGAGAVLCVPETRRIALPGAVKDAECILPEVTAAAPSDAKPALRRVLSADD